MLFCTLSSKKEGREVKGRTGNKGKGGEGREVKEGRKERRKGKDGRVVPHAHFKEGRKEGR